MCSLDKNKGVIYKHRHEFMQGSGQLRPIRTRHKAERLIRSTGTINVSQNKIPVGLTDKT